MYYPELGEVYALTLEAGELFGFFLAACERGTGYRGVHTCETASPRDPR